MNIKRCDGCGEDKYIQPCLYKTSSYHFCKLCIKLLNRGSEKQVIVNPTQYQNLIATGVLREEVGDVYNS